MNLSEIFTILYATIIIAICHIPIYYLLLDRCQNPSQTLLIIFLVYMIVLIIFYTFFPFIRDRTSNKQTEEEKQ